MKWQYVKKEKMHLIEVENDLGLRVQFLKAGASIYAIYFKDKLMTLTPSTIKEFLKPNIYYGKTIGPIANRVENAVVEINGKNYKMHQNEGVNCLHSGKQGLSNCMFDLVNVAENEEGIAVLFKFTVGFASRVLPGKVTYTVGYTISNKDNSILLNLDALTDKDTVISLTNHAYFTLGEENLAQISLTLPAKTFIETRDTDLIALRERDILPCLDFNTPKRILKDIDDPYLKNHKSFGIDHAFHLEGNNLTLESLHYRLDIESDFKYCQIYSDNYEDGIEMLGTKDKHYRGVAIEPEDSLLVREITPAYGRYSRYIRYTFTEK